MHVCGGQCGRLCGRLWADISDVHGGARGFRLQLYHQHVCVSTERGSVSLCSQYGYICSSGTFVLIFEVEVHLFAKHRCLQVCVRMRVRACMREKERGRTQRKKHHIQFLNRRERNFKSLVSDFIMLVNFVLSLSSSHLPSLPNTPTTTTTALPSPPPSSTSSNAR